jgi:putative ABC transport system substrate-binding protein
MRTARVHGDALWRDCYVARRSCAAAEPRPQARHHHRCRKKTPEYVAALAAFEQVLGSLGWKQGNNLQIDDRWSAGGPESARSAANEIVALVPDVILAQSAAGSGSPAVDNPDDPNRSSCMLPTRSLMDSSRTWRDPGGNVTGITNIEPAIGG